MNKDKVFNNVSIPEDAINGNYVVFSKLYGGYVKDFIIGKNAIAKLVGLTEPISEYHTMTTDDKYEAHRFLNKKEAEFVANHWNVKGYVEDLK